jgi:hypothetical protein
MSECPKIFAAFVSVYSVAWMSPIRVRRLLQRERITSADLSTQHIIAPILIKTIQSCAPDNLDAGPLQITKQGFQVLNPLIATGLLDFVPEFVLNFLCCFYC